MYSVGNHLLPTHVFEIRLYARNLGKMFSEARANLEFSVLRRLPVSKNVPNDPNQTHYFAEMTRLKSNSTPSSSGMTPVTRTMTVLFRGSSESRHHQLKLARHVELVGICSREQSI